MDIEPEISEEDEEITSDVFLPAQGLKYLEDNGYAYYVKCGFHGAANELSQGMDNSLLMNCADWNPDHLIHKLNVLLYKISHLLNL